MLKSQKAELLSVKSRSNKKQQSKKNKYQLPQDNDFECGIVAIE